MLELPDKVVVPEVGGHPEIGCEFRYGRPFAVVGVMRVDREEKETSEATAHWILRSNGRVYLGGRAWESNRLQLLVDAEVPRLTMVLPTVQA